MVWHCGIDTCAHKFALELNGKTIAVLPCGFNNIYPPENKSLYRKILEYGGAIISEYSPDVQANSKKFLERNRIVSGISIGILVIEAKNRSGTSVTAKFAKEQNKKIFVLPHEIWDINGVGTNRLLQNGAILITKTEDILDNIKNVKKEKIKEVKIKGKIEIEESTDKKIKKNNNFAKSKMKKEEYELKYSQIKNDDYKKIYKILQNQIYGINEIIRKSNKSVAEINQILFMMEIEGLVQKTEGGYKCI